LAPFIVFALVLAAIVVALYASNGWREVTEWSVAARLLAVVVALAPIVALVAWHANEMKRAEDERNRKAESLDRTLKPPTGRSMRETMLWSLGGMLPGFVLGWVIFDDPALRPTLGLFAFMFLPFLGAGLGFFLSPAGRAMREHQEKVETVLTRQQETPEERYQREKVSANWQSTQATWRQRAYDALVWWSSQGEKLTSKSDYLLALVRQHRGGGLSQDFLGKYQNPDDPCSTPQRAEQVAMWALANLPDLVAQHIANPSERTVPGLVKILIEHHQRDMRFYKEANAYYLNQALEAYRDETPEHLVERLLMDLDAVALAREKGMKRIQEAAAMLKPDARSQYIQAATAGVNALLDAWMAARTSAAK
jgi:hypothetical protein